MIVFVNINLSQFHSLLNNIYEYVFVDESKSSAELKKFQIGVIEFENWIIKIMILRINIYFIYLLLFYSFIEIIFYIII